MNNKTQKERLDDGRELFNKVLLLNSKADTIYEAISEWECTYEIDCYNGNNFYIEDLLIDYGREDIIEKLKINNKSGRGTCICAQRNLLYVFYIRNKFTNKVLPTGSDCIAKVFPDGSILRTDIELLKKLLSKPKKGIKALKRENAQLDIENQKLKREILSLNAKLLYLQNQNNSISDIFFNEDKLIEYKAKISQLEEENKKYFVEIQHLENDNYMKQLIIDELFQKEKSKKF